MMQFGPLTRSQMLYQHLQKPQFFFDDKFYSDFSPNPEHEKAILRYFGDQTKPTTIYVNSPTKPGKKDFVNMPPKKFMEPMPEGDVAAIQAKEVENTSSFLEAIQALERSPFSPCSLALLELLKKTTSIGTLKLLATHMPRKTLSSGHFCYMCELALKQGENEEAARFLARALGMEDPELSTARYVYPTIYGPKEDDKPSNMQEYYETIQSLFYGIYGGDIIPPLPELMMKLAMEKQDYSFVIDLFKGMKNAHKSDEANKMNEKALKLLDENRF